MLNELAKIIEILDIPESDPAAKRLRQRGLAFYRINEMLKLKTEIGSRYFEVERYDPHANGRNETQEFEAVSYLFGACINFQDKNYGCAIKAASYALAMFRQTSRGRTFNEGLAHWFLGTLYRLVNDSFSAIEEFKEAISILDERMREFESESDYKKMSYCIDLKPQIATRVSPEFFSEIIGRFQIPKEDAQLYDRWVAIREMEPSDLNIIDSNIESLNNILAPETEEFFDAIPFDIIFLAHCYNLGFYAWEGSLEYQECALFTATERFDDYISHLGEYNQFVSRTYLAFLHYNIFDVSNGLLHLKEADGLLGRLLEENIDADTRNIQSLQMELQAWIDQFEAEIMDRYYEEPESQEIQQPKVGIFEKITTSVKRLFDNTSAPDEPPYTQSEFDVPQVRLDTEEQNKQKQSKGIPPREPTPNPPLKNDEAFIRHLIVPVDIRALEETSREIIPLEHELYRKLETFDNQKAHSEGSKEGIPPINNNSRTMKRTLIPEFPIYGSVSAGPKGEALLPDPDGLLHIDEVDETLRIKIQGREYETKFIDSSIHSFSKGKSYGWLKVTGDSMNKASPYSIKRDDYVLFRENHDLESCNKKIVIALLSEMDTQPPCLMVKRLVKMSGEIPCRDDGFGHELCKFVLHSESSLDRDPNTGASFKKDIEIEKDYQLVGEVIAVAKQV